MTSRLLLATSALMLAPAIALAGVGKISGPEVEQGEFEAKYLGTHTEDDRASKDDNNTHRLEFEYGFTENWSGEIGFKADDYNNQEADLKAVYLEALRTMTRQSDGWWLSSGLLGEYVVNTDHGPNKVEGQLRLQRMQGPVRVRFNTTLEREVGGGDEEEIEIGTRASAMYKTHPNINPAIEWHADWGTLSDIKPSDEQSHWVGPALYGKLFELADGSEIEYQAAYVFGLTDASEDGVARFILEYKREF